jgi:ubiquinone/menaquinone biosynthesis C-methylase UbiE
LKLIERVHRTVTPKATFRIGLDLILNWLINHKNKLIRELKRIAKKAGDYWVCELVGVKNVM